MVAQLYPVVMAGGSGTRFWPYSRKNKPKQFLAIGTEQPLLLETFNRLDALAPWENRYVVAGEVHADPILNLCPNMPKNQLLIEPCPRNTAPCVALAALHLYERDPNGIMLVLPSDHHISELAHFQKAIKSAMLGASENKIITLGIKPTRPETGYGYIQYPGGGVLNESRLSVKRFVEKPPFEVAKEYLESGEYLWNSGVFFFTPALILSEIQRQMPDLYQALEVIRPTINTPAYETTLNHVFAQLKSVSIDVGIMEGAKNIEVIPVDMGWNDVGHWAALEDFAPKDPNGNVIEHEKHFLIDASQNIVQSDSFVALIGVSNLIVVQTPDAVLVCPKDRSQDVRLVVEWLKKHKKEELI